MKVGTIQQAYVKFGKRIGSEEGSGNSTSLTGSGAAGGVLGAVGAKKVLELSSEPSLMPLGVIDVLHSFRVYFHIFSTRFECIFTSSPLVSSVFLRLLHSFRVQILGLEKSQFS